VWKPSGELDVTATATVLMSKIEHMDVFVIDDLVADVHLLAQEVGDWNVENAYFFPLCRKVKARFDRSEWKGLGRTLFPLGLLFIELLDRGGKLEDKENWTSADAVAVEFEFYWQKVNYAEGEDLRSVVLDRARNNPVLLGPGTLTLFVNYAWHLQKQAGKIPIFLPVNEDMAGLFQVSERMIGKYVDICVDRAYLTQKSGYVPHQRARTFMMNLDHPDFIPIKTVSAR